MEVGIKEAKNTFSQLLVKAQNGEPVYVTRNGKRVAEIRAIDEEIPAEIRAKKGLGWLKGKINLLPGWDTDEARREATEKVLTDMGLPNGR